MHMKRWLLLCLLVCGLAAEAQHEATKSPLVPVGVWTVERYTPPGGARYATDIRPARQVDLAFRVGGYVQELLQVRGVDGQLRNVQEGDRVSKGAVLARLRESDYQLRVSQAKAQLAEVQASQAQVKAQLAEVQASQAQAQALVAEVQASYEQSRLDFERARHLLAAQSLTRPEYEAAQARFEGLQAKKDSAKAQLSLVQATGDKVRAQLPAIEARRQGARAQSEEANLALQDSALKAPFEAVVLKRTLEVGTLVAPGVVGFVLADIASVKAVFGVPDTLVQHVQLGTKLEITTEAMPGTRFPGQISRIAPSADPKNRTFEVEVSLSNPQGQLKVGSIGALEIATQAEPKGAGPVAVLPPAAVVRAKDDPTHYTVFVVQEQGGKPVARLRRIKLGNAVGNMIAVLEGLQVGERVITTGTALVGDGTPVQVLP